MAIHNHNGLLLLQLILFIWAIKASEALMCPNGCEGEEDIKFPFGIGEGCYFDRSFEVVCDNSSGSLKAVLKSVNLKMPPPFGYNSNGFVIVNVSVIALNSRNVEGVNLTGTQFSFSQTENRFIATGCHGFPLQNKQNDSSSKINDVQCQSICICDPAVTDDCCDLSCTISTNTTKVFDGNTWYKYYQSTPQECSSVLIVLRSWPFINYRRNELTLKDQEHVPAVLEWAKHRGNCYEEYKSHSSQMCNKDNRCLIQLGSGYYCVCSSEISDFCSGNLYCNTTSGHNCLECPDGYIQSDSSSDGELQCFPLRSKDSFIISKVSRDKKLIVIGTNFYPFYF